MIPELNGILWLAGIRVTLGLFMTKRIDRVGDRVTQLEVSLPKRMVRPKGLFEGCTRQTKLYKLCVPGCYTVRTCQ